MIVSLKKIREFGCEHIDLRGQCIIETLENNYAIEFCVCGLISLVLHHSMMKPCDLIGHH